MKALGVTVLVDPDYRGNVGVLLRNNSDEAQILERGEAIAQVIMEKAAMPEVVEMKTPKTCREELVGLTQPLSKTPQPSKRLSQ